jgi:hypothetical protein
MQTLCLLCFRAARSRNDKQVTETQQTQRKSKWLSHSYFKGLCEIVLYIVDMFNA